MDRLKRAIAAGAVMGAAGLALTLGATAQTTPSTEVSSSVTERLRHASCDVVVWSHLERRALERAEVFCAERGGIDDKDLRYVHHESEYGADHHVCTLHLHYDCQAALPGD